MIYLGDFETSDTVICPFPAYDSNGSSVTITGLAVTDIEIYKDGSTTQRSSDNGYALLDTDGIDFDGITGAHGFSVDLSDNSDAGYYANGSQIVLWVNAVTIDTRTVVIGYIFSIGRYLKPTTAGRTLDVTATGAAGMDWGNVENQSTSVDLSSTDIQLCDTTTTLTGHTAQTGDSYARLGPPAGASVSADIAAAKAETALIVADTNELQTDWANGGRLDLIIDIIAVDTTTDIPALIATAQADLDIITGASGVNLLTATQASIDAIEADTNELQGDWVNGGRLDLILDIIAVDTTTDIPALIATAQADLDIITGASGAILLTATQASIDAIKVVTDNLASAATTNIEGTVDTGSFTSTTTEFEADDITEATADHYNGRIVLFTSGALLGQATDITDYALSGSNGHFTVTALTEAPANNVTFVIV